MTDIPKQIDERTALYYPYLVPQDDLWLKQALLYWDRIGSIIPDRIKSTPGVLTNDLEYLETNGVFTTLDPGNFGHFINPDNIIEDIKQIITNPNFQLIKKQYYTSIGVRKFNSETCVIPMYMDKFTPYIVDELKKIGIIIGNHNTGEYSMDMVESGVYMSVLTKHYAGGSGYIGPSTPALVPVTDSPSIRNLLYYSNNNLNQSGEIGINLVLKNIFPAPGNDVPLSDILEFKEKHKQELLNFRGVMDKFYGRLSRVKYADELMMASDDISSEIKEAVDSLTRTMQDVRMSVIQTSAEVLLNIASINLLPPTAELALTLITGGRALLSAHKCYLNIEKLKITKESPFNYLLYTRNQFG
ncbi:MULTISPECIES: DUF6236 family protein [Sporomusa]|uniref:DUF6236 family protein n=1 Tax=Sporomusa TaxID=2375 RepID=UPI00202E3AAA|nr:DUF6236 family protein [Sporomusa sphaeroides]MCM0757715.1 DUF6236 family protein [Sporomusa sphaeroides DSM 2875]